MNYLIWVRNLTDLLSSYLFLKGHFQGQQMCGERNKSTPRVCRAFIEVNKLAANAGKVAYHALSHRRHPSKFVHIFGRVPALGAAMTESALSNFKRLSRSQGASIIFQQTRGKRGE